MLDERIHVAQADRQRAGFHVVHQRLAGLHAAFQLKGNHAAVVMHLAAGQRVIGVAFQPGIVHPLDLGVVFQVARHLHGVLAMALHAQFKGLQADVCQPGVKRAGRTAQHLEQAVELLAHPAHVPADHRAADHQAVA